MSGEKFDGVSMIVQRLGAIETKLDENNSMTGDIRVSVAAHAEILKAQHDQLVEHIRRTYNIEERIMPIEQHVSRVSGMVKLMVILGGIASFLLAAAKLITD